MTRHTLSLVIGFAVPASTQPGRWASFDCAKASSAIENTIRADPVPSSPDETLAARYVTQKKRLGAASLHADQRPGADEPSMVADRNCCAVVASERWARSSDGLDLLIDQSCLSQGFDDVRIPGASVAPIRAPGWK